MSPHRALLAVLGAAVGASLLTWAVMDATDNTSSERVVEVVQPAATHVTRPAPKPSRHWADCEPAPTALVRRISARPQPEADLTLSDARLVGAPDGNVVLAVVDFSTPGEDPDPFVAQWLVRSDGAITAFDDGAGAVTRWPADDRHDITTGTTMVVAACEDELTAALVAQN